MSIETEEELRALRAAGRVVAEALRAMRRAVRPGIATSELDAEPPEVPNYHVPGARQPLTEGLVLTIEPIVSAGTGAVVAGDDGWTVRTADGALAAHAEHTVVITRDRPLVLTA